MRYLLTIPVLGETPIREINEERFQQLKSARDVLSESLALEEKYEILLSNYLSLEREILVRAAEGLARSTFHYEKLAELRLAFNLRLANLLSACRLYLDTAPRHVRQCLNGEEAGFKRMIQLTNEAYDSSLAYRFMEALRNHVQHNGMAIHKITIGTGWDKEKELLESGFALRAIKKLLIADKEFKKSVLDEVGDEVDLMISTREYMECLGKIHHEARLMVKRPTEFSRDVIENERQSFSDEFSIARDDLLSLEAQALDGASTKERVVLMLDWDDVREKLVSQNSSLTNISKRYISSRSRAK